MTRYLETYERILPDSARFLEFFFPFSSRERAFFSFILGSQKYLAFVFPNKCVNSCVELLARCVRKQNGRCNFNVYFPFIRGAPCGRISRLTIEDTRHCDDCKYALYSFRQAITFHLGAQRRFLRQIFRTYLPIGVKFLAPRAFQSFNSVYLGVPFKRTTYSSP